MKAYIVGGAVRDRLLGLPVQDRDFVVVGATPEEMLEQGFLPVGRDFPVFLHPRTREEYALARTERKSGRGYHGFTFYAAGDVTLEQDLARRDLTINAIAEDADGSLIDPYGGQRDLRDRVFRHVGPAFAEDPVRILRVARFAARFADFSVAPETVALMRRMVESGEVDALVAERVWQELARGLMERAPSRMLEVLHACGALAHIAPELHMLRDLPGLTGEPVLPVFSGRDDGTARVIPDMLDLAAHRGLNLAQRFALLVAGVGVPQKDPAAALLPLFERLRPPGDCRDLALILAHEAAWLNRTSGSGETAGNAGNARTGIMPPDALNVLKLFERCDAVRRPERFEQMLQAWVVDAAVRAEEAAAQNLVNRLRHALQAARAIDAGAIARSVAVPTPQLAGHEAGSETLRGVDDSVAARIPAAIRDARLQAIAVSLAESTAS